MVNSHHNSCSRDSPFKDHANYNIVYHFSVRKANISCKAPIDNRLFLSFMLYSYKSVYANFQLQQCYSKEKGTGTHMEQNNISEQENDLQTNEKKDNKKTDEKE